MGFKNGENYRAGTMSIRSGRRGGSELDAGHAGGAKRRGALQSAKGAGEGEIWSLRGLIQKA